MRQADQRPSHVLGKRIIGGLDEAVNWAVFVLMIVMMLFGLYALWDSRQVNLAAEPARYAVYKPKASEKDGTMTFEELRAINSEVFAWLTVNGTKIDYPVAQSGALDGQKYITTNALGVYSSSGCPFLDSASKADFSDFASIIYAHHMADGMMFGDLQYFKDESYFNSHPYGKLYYGGKDHGIEFFAFLQVDAYDSILFSPAVTPAAYYYNTIRSRAMHWREISVGLDDHLVLLSTCTSDETNGRQMLVGRLTDTVFSDGNSGPASGGGAMTWWQRAIRFLKTIPCWIWLLILLAILLLMGWAVYRHREAKKRSSERKPEDHLEQR